MYFLRQLSFLFFLFILMESQAQQIIHIPNKDLVDSTDGYNFTVNANAHFTQNINDIFSTGNQFNGLYVKNKSRLMLMHDYNLTIFNGNAIVNNSFQHLRYGYAISKTTTLEAFVQTQFNEIINIKFRGLTGAGARFELLKKDKFSLVYGTIMMLEYEEETEFPEINRAIRASNYLSLGVDVFKNMHVDLISYYQPDILLWEDYRFNVEAVIQFRLSNRLSFSLIHAYFYDSRPPKNIRRNFYNFRNGLTYRFRD